MLTRIGQLRDEDGVTLVELLVAMLIGVIVMLGTFAVVQAGNRSAARTTSRIVANQSVRPVLSRIMDELHSSCVSPDLAPIQTGSSGTSLTFIYSVDNGVTPVPTKRTISYTPTTATTGILNEAVYPYVSGSAPNWVFGGTPVNRQLLSNMGPTASIDGANVPPFRYYAYDDSTGLISTTPIDTSTPLDATEAASVVKVVVSLRYTPKNSTATPDTWAAASFSDSAILRFTPASTASGENTPCS